MFECVQFGQNELSTEKSVCSMAPQFNKEWSRKVCDDYEGRGLPSVEHFGHVRTEPCIEYGYCLSLASIDGESPFPGYVTPRCCTSIG